MLILTACGGSDHTSSNPPIPPVSAPPIVSKYSVTALVSSGTVAAANIDPRLQASFAFAFDSMGNIWAANNTTATEYDATGAVQPMTITLPTGADAPLESTAIIFNNTSDFSIAQNGLASPAEFIFAGALGKISVWAPSVSPTNAINVVSVAGAIYTGMAMGNNGTANFLYATNFPNQKIDVFDKNFAPITLDGNFEDPAVPAGFGPFSITVMGTSIFVGYAQIDSAGTEAHGPGLGLVDVFDTNGHFIRRFATGGVLNAPSGIALAPANFGVFSNDLLIANVGDGTINAFNPNTGALVGQLTQPDGTAISEPEIGGIAFGSGQHMEASNSLYFSVGSTPTTGLIGRIDLAPGG